MKVKIGNKVYSDKDEPIMLILTDGDKKNIANMNKECTKYAAYPESFELRVDKWMDDV